MFKHLWVERSHVCLTQNIFLNIFFILLINNEPILTCTLAAGIVPDAFAGEVGDAKRR